MYTIFSKQISLGAVATYIFLLAIVFTLLVGQAYASETMPLIQFSIKPRICVLSGREAVCHDELEIKWQAETRRSLCLYRSDDNKPLQCWEQALQGEHYIKISASDNVEFQLKEKANAYLLASENFEVIQDNVQYRRRRRNAWSFF